MSFKHTGCKCCINKQIMDIKDLGEFRFYDKLPYIYGKYLALPGPKSQLCVMADVRNNQTLSGECAKSFQVNRAAQAPNYGNRAHEELIH